MLYGSMDFYLSFEATGKRKSPETIAARILFMGEQWAEILLDNGDEPAINIFSAEKGKELIFGKGSIYNDDYEVSNIIVHNTDEPFTIRSFFEGSDSEIDKAECHMEAWELLCSWVGVRC